MAGVVSSRTLKTGDACPRKGVYESSCGRGHFRFHRTGKPMAMCEPCSISVRWLTLEIG